MPMFPYHIHYPADNVYSVDGQPSCHFSTCMIPHDVQQHIHHGEDDTRYFGNMMFPESQDHLGTSIYLYSIMRYIHWRIWES